MFKVECPGCNAPYQVDERRVPSGGLKMRCPKCGNSFQVEPPADTRSTGPSPVLGAALGASQPAKKPTMLGVSGPPRPAAKLGVPTAPLAIPTRPAEDPYGEVDLPTIGNRGGTKPLGEIDLPAPARPRVAAPLPEKPQAPPPTDLGPISGAADDELDLPTPLGASPAGRFGELDLPMLSGDRKAPPAPPARNAPTLPRLQTNEIDLPVVGQARAPNDLPAHRTDAGLPAPRGVPGFGELDLPSPGAGARGRTADLPERLDAGLPSPAAGLPSPSAGLPELGGAALPIAAAGLPAAATAGLPVTGGTLPVASAGLPATGGAGLPTAGGVGLPGSGTASLPQRPDSFGELELPLGGSVPPSGPTSHDGVVRQSGGGTSYGEVNLDGGEAAVNIRADDDMEFGAIPQERSAPPPAAVSPAARPIVAAPVHVPRPSAPVLVPTQLKLPRKSRVLRIVLGLITVLALAGGALALVPSIGPFGAHWIIDKLKSGDYEKLAGDTAKKARELLAADTHPQAKLAQDTVESARSSQKRVQALAAYSAYVAFLRELRFGTDSAARARAQLLLAELREVQGVSGIELARAAEAAASGQLARARQALTTLEKKSPKDIDVMVLRGELELRARDPKAALAAWTAAEGVEHSARTAFGQARARAALGDVEGSKKLANQTLERNAGHVGAKILLAETSWQTQQAEKAAIKLLGESVTQVGQASPDEIVAAQTLLGKIHLARSRITHAETAFGEALKVSPKAAGALGGLGEALFRAGRYSEALARFEAAVQADPDDIDAKVGVARTLLALERVLEARSALKKLRDTHPKSMQVSYWYGKVNEAQGNRKDAEDAYRAAIEQGGTHPDVVQAYVALALLYNQLGRSEEAQKLLGEARKKLAESPSIHKALGELALIQGRYEEALGEFRKALALDADDVGAKFKLGVALRKNRNFDEAEKAFDEVAAVDRDYPGLALERGLLYEGSGNSDEALKAYESALAKAPSDPDLMLRVGCGKVAAGRGKEAIELLRKVQEKRPTSAETLHCLGRALLVEGTNLVEALRTLERATEVDPHRAEYWLYVGWAANEAGRTARAKSALAKALELDQGLADAYWQRGVLLVREGAVKDAVIDLRKALELRPSRFEAHAALADAYYDLGMEGEALAEWQHAVSSMPDNATWRFRYGKLLVDNRRPGDARDNLSKAIELSEKHDERPKWLAEAHLELARLMGANKDAAKHWKAFLQHGPRDSAYRAEAKRALEQLGQPWTAN